MFSQTASSSVDLFREKLGCSFVLIGGTARDEDAAQSIFNERTAIACAVLRGKIQ